MISSEIDFAVVVATGAQSRRTVSKPFNSTVVSGSNKNKTLVISCHVQNSINGCLIKIIKLKITSI